MSTKPIERPYRQDETEALGVYIKLMRASRAVIGRVEPRVHAACLTTTQLGVLEGILHKGPLTQRELGRKVLTSAGNMTDVIDKLERRGLVQRTRPPSDRRRVQVDLTTEGRRTIEQLFPGHVADITDAMSALTRDELRQLDALLRKLGLAAAQAETAPSPLSTEPPCPTCEDNRSTSNE